MLEAKFQPVGSRSAGLRMGARKPFEARLLIKFPSFKKKSGWAS